MKNINKFIVYCLLTLSIISGYFVCAYKKAFASEIPTTLLDETFIETWLFPLFSLNNEWSFGQSGINLKDAIEESAGSDNINYSTDLNNAYAEAFGINDLIDPFDLSKADEFYTAYFANDVNYKKFVLEHKYQDIKDYLTSSDCAELEAFLIDEDKIELLEYNSTTEAFENCIFATIQIGKQKMLVAFDEAGNWLGNSFKNILDCVEPLTQKDINNIKINDLPNTSSNIYSNSLLYSNISMGWTVIANIPDNLVFYSQQTSGATKSLYAIIPESLMSSSGSYRTYNAGTLTMKQIGQNYTLTGSFYVRTNTYFTVDNYRFYYGLVSLYNNGSYSVTEPLFSTTYNDAMQWVTDNFDAVKVKIDIPPYTVPLVDEQSVPYEVPSIQGLAQTIDHIYPAIDALRNTILTIPSDIADVLSLVDTVPATIAEDIADIIADAIRDAISIPDILTEDTTADPDPDPDPDNPIPEIPPELPSWFWPTLFPDVFDFKGLEIFKPIFDIVGNNYSMYPIWVMIPAIIIFVVIIYFIISVL